MYVNVTRKITLLWAPLKDERNVRKTNNSYIPFVKFSPLTLFFLLYMSIFITLFHTFSFLFHIYFMFFFPLIVPSSFNRKYFMDVKKREKSEGNNVWKLENSRCNFTHVPCIIRIYLSTTFLLFFSYLFI